MFNKNFNKSLQSRSLDFVCRETCSSLRRSIIPFDYQTVKHIFFNYSHSSSYKIQPKFAFQITHIVVLKGSAIY